MMSWEMDIDGESSGALGQMDDLENYAFENESCGICGDIIIDRGVLDCCQHWFCYTCIDNWAAITNRCPLCKSEFQHITCSRVYDMSGTTTEDEYPLASDDDDWYLQGESSALSFPSYYIDAEAVVCLDDGGCKVRSGLAAAKGDSTLDTSIACDACDKWYHALCVGFNPDIPTGNSWLCPRCMPTEVNQEADVIFKQKFSEERVIGSDRTSTDASFSGRVSVSVADEGETALVVSMVGIHPEIKGGLSEVGVKTAREAFNGTSCPSDSKDDLTHDTVADASLLRNTDVSSRSHNKSSEMNIFCTVSSETTERSLQFSPIRESATTLFSSEQGNMSTEQLGLPKLVSSYSFAENSKEAENRGQENAVHKHNNEISITRSPLASSPASKLVRSPDIDMIDEDADMKTSQKLELPLRHDGHKSSDNKTNKRIGSGNEVSHPAKKAKLEAQEQERNLIGNSGVSSTHSHATVSAKATFDDMPNSSKHNSVQDILSIVEGDDYGRDIGREQAKPVGRRAGDKSGLRVKKIFRKEGKESSDVVQKLQQEIREVARDTGTNILKSDGSFDEKLLKAFREAIGKPVDGSDKNTNLSLIRAKRALLQKGRKRENLTKKLYGTSAGRRRSEWHRDMDVEFWKYRCSPGVNPEKIETLQSVLQLLRKSSEMDKESAQGKKEEKSNSILSRLYLADASVVPRKDDIKPLSVISGCAPLDKDSQTKANNIKSPNKSATGTEATRINSSSSGKVSSSSTLSKEATSRRDNRISQPSQDQKQTTDGVKHDKRKWALEILARKNASLAQLPADMRPQPTAGRNSKIPLSVRQAQLRRIAEHYLQKANMDVIRRCAESELAIADAVNVEKDIYERSNSKLVYVNLCSQAAHQPTKAKSDNEASDLAQKTESGCDLTPQTVTSEITNVSGGDMEDVLNRAFVSDEKSELGDDIMPEPTVSKHTFSFSSAEEALKEAGLFDSPPNSPEKKAMKAEEDSYKCTVDLDSEPSKTLQSIPGSRLTDISSLEDNNSTVMPCEKPKDNSEEHQKLTSGRETNDTTSETNAVNLAEADRNTVHCEKTSGPGTEISVESNTPDEGIGHVGNSKDMEKAESRLPSQSPNGNDSARDAEVISKPKNLEPSREKSSSDNPSLNIKHPKGDKPSHRAERGGDSKKPIPDQLKKNSSDSSSSIYKKVEMFVKEHIRPLCKSGVITVDQYRWAVTKTTDKVMNFHQDAKNASFLIKEGDKVKKLALQYVEAAQEKVN
ncbi:hypothetical protein EJB05_17163 [Eragrostis curvula]|uniref:RING-type domain-containing protein n=1 Tax=Eragrostis curvula TaxID=38414 RepID=A0A5J9VGK4_9POAL|nr:hypothetical protein EJB05_17163 [Eragrostis curvula]